MKRFWLILLSLGLVMALSVPAFALDVKFSGSYYAAGMYQDKTTFTKGVNLGPGNPNEGPSTAFYFQRLRVQTDFIVSPGLSLITRFDALERAWGAPRSIPSGWNGEHLDDSDAWYFTSAGTAAENENIAFEWAYIKYASPIGVFTVGYQEYGAWGTVFGNNAVNGAPEGTIGWSLPMGGWTLLAQIVKLDEFSRTAKNPSTVTDGDADEYIAGFIYNWKDGQAGARYTFYRNAVYKAGMPGILTALNSIQPYAIAKIGPVTIQAELNYYWGDLKYENGSTTSIKLEAINFYVDAVANFNVFYFGGTFAYLSGNNPDTADKIEGGSWLYWANMSNNATGGGLDWNPCLIMFNFERTYWAGYIRGYNGTTNGSPMQNAWFGQLRGGVRPLAALDIMASVSYAVADQKGISGFMGPVISINKNYGTEVDLTATYKITNNLYYMLGVGYLFTGDYYKGTTADADLRDNYLITNKLTLTF